MALRRGTFFDLPADLSLALFSFPISSSVIIDSASMIEGIRDVIGDGTLIARTADSTKRHTLAKINGFDSAYSADTNRGGLLLTDYSKLPIGDAERHMTWVVVSQDGVVGGYRGGGRQYWIDNPFPDYRLRTNVADYTGSGSTNNSQLHGLSINHRNISGATSRSQMTVDGSLRLDQPVTLNTSLGTYGIKGAETSYFTMKGNTVLHYIGKRAATVDEQYKIDSACQFYTGMTLPSGHPYAATPWLVEDAPTGNIGTSVGTSQIFAVALANIAANGATSGTAIATSQVAALVRAAGGSVGTATAAGDARVTILAAGASVGTAAAMGAPLSTVTVTGASVGNSEATGQGLTVQVGVATGYSAATSFAIATPLAIANQTGRSTGASIVAAVPLAMSVTVGAANGTAQAFAVTASGSTAVGRSTGVSAVAALGLAQVRALGVSVGSSTVRASLAKVFVMPPATNIARLTDTGSRVTTIADSGPRALKLS